MFHPFADLLEDVRCDGHRTDPIPRDVLGMPVRSGTISGYGKGGFNETDKWSFRSMCNDDSCSADDFFELADEVRAHGYVVKTEYTKANPPKPGYGGITIICPHPAGIAEAERIEHEQAKKEAQGTPIYVRFGKIPPGGKSHDFRDNRTLPGVSCYRALRLPNGKVMLKQNTDDLRINARLLNAKRAAYEITGKEVGTGSDGEPLLANAKLGKRVRVE